MGALKSMDFGEVKDVRIGKYMELELDGDSRESEEKRLKKELDKVATEKEGVEKKLSNEAFVGKAPKEVVAKERERVAGLTEKMAREAGYQIPDWTAEAITAVGEGTDPAIDTPQGRLRAARAAEVDAKRKLAEQVYGLMIDSSTSVRDFVTQYDEIRTQVDAVLIGAVPEQATFEAGVARVKVTLPAHNVWRVVYEHKLIMDRRG